MRRRLLAVLTLLALASCFGRVAAWAASPRAHACCHAAPDSGKPVSVSECCAAAALSPRPAAPSPVLEFFGERAPLPIPTYGYLAAAAVPTATPAFQDAAPARAPPLA